MEWANEGPKWGEIARKRETVPAGSFQTIRQAADSGRRTGRTAAPFGVMLGLLERYVCPLHGDRWLIHWFIREVYFLLGFLARGHLEQKPAVARVEVCDGCSSFCYSSCWLEGFKNEEERVLDGGEVREMERIEMREEIREMR